jgi:hypothetical protein
MKIKYRLITTEDRKLDSYILSDDNNQLHRICYKDIVNYDIDNATINTENFTCRANKGVNIQTITLRNYNKQFIPVVDDTNDEFDWYVSGDLEYWLRKMRETNLTDVVYLYGAPRVGKTSVLRNFCYSNFDNIVYVDLNNDTHNILNILLKSNIRTIGDRLAAFAHLNYGVTFKSRTNSVLILDNMPCNVTAAVLSKLRNYGSCLNFSIIVAGTMIPTSLGIQLNRSSSKGLFIVNMLSRRYGDVSTSLYWQYVKRKESNGVNFADAAYVDYKHWGGYPEVVKSYFDTAAIKKHLANIWSVIIARCAECVPEKERSAIPTVVKHVVYTSLTTTRVNEVMDYAGIAQASRVCQATVMKVRAWLIDNGILLRCAINPDGDITHVSNCSKYYLNDCGLLTYFLTYVVEANSIDKQRLVTENFVYLVLFDLGCMPSTAIYNNHKIDFVILRDHFIWGIIIDSSVKSAEALKVFFENGLIDYAVELNDTVRNSRESIKYEDDIKSAPTHRLRDILCRCY